MTPWFWGILAALSAGGFALAWWWCRRQVAQLERLLASGDAPPVQGDFPTTLWRARDWIDDTHTLLIPTDLLPGNYHILIGLYEPVSGARLNLVEGGDSLRIPLEIRP